jgi:predicted ATPase
VFISRIKLKNWRNFQNVDVPLGHRTFLVGPNASGKSNFLDAIRFLRHIANPKGGGLEAAVIERGGVSKIRSLAARKDSNVEIEIELSDAPGADFSWRYAIGFTHDKLRSGQLSMPRLVFERVWRKDEKEPFLNRPSDTDKNDDRLLTQTHLQQIGFNKDFREISQFLISITYLHLVPQFLRHPGEFADFSLPDDPYGKDLLKRIVQKPEKSKKKLLEKIEVALKTAVPQLSKLEVKYDEMGAPHLQAKYDHWRPQGGIQREDQFSDGTLRLIGLLWALLELEADSVLLLEEPEISLHSSIVEKLPNLFYNLTKHQNRKRRGQVILSTHSADMLSDRSIDGGQVILLTPKSEGTEAQVAGKIEEIRNYLESGFSMAEAVIPYTKPALIDQLSSFDK